MTTSLKVSAVPFKGFPCVLGSQQFDPTWLLEKFFPLALAMKRQSEEYGHLLAGRRIGVFFTEPSLRTYYSFIIAATNLGAQVFANENMAQVSSMVKGETPIDTAKILSGYGFDLLVIRHKEEGAVDRIADHVSIPVINGGDGTSQHPTQALLDLFTIWEHFGHLDDLRVALVGDLARGRTHHSLAYLLAKFPGVHFTFLSPEGHTMKPEILDYLDRHNASYDTLTKTDIREVAAGVDVLYMGRPQKERPDDNGTVGEAAFRSHMELIYVDADVADRMHDRAIIMHPLPRTWEISTVVDGHPRARYFEQARNGLFVRMALLAVIFHPGPYCLPA